MSTNSNAPGPSFVGPAATIYVAPSASRGAIDLSSYFRRVEGYQFTVRRSRNSAIATATASGNLLTVTGVAKGETEIIVRATSPSDRWIFAQGKIPVVVNTAGVAPPTEASSQPTRTMQVGETLDIDLTEHIANLADWTDALTVTEDTPDLATATLTDTTLTVTAKAKGEASFTIGVPDADFSLTLPVTVAPVPLAVEPQPARQVEAEATLVIDLAEHVQNIHDRPLTVTAHTPERATATLDGSILTVTGVAPGTASFTVGMEGLDFSLILPVTVTTPPQVYRSTNLFDPDRFTTPYAPDTATVALTINGESCPTAEELKVYRVRGEEAISRLFRYEIDLVRLRVNDDQSLEYQPLASEDVLGKPATLTVDIAEGDNTPMPRRVYGIIGEFRELTKSSLEGWHYRLVLVPRLAKLAYNQQSRIHATSETQTLVDIVKYKLSASGEDYKSPASASEDDSKYATLAEDEFSIDDIDETRLPRQTLSHITQYNETDLNFLCRLCEHYGIYFFFKEKIDADAEDAWDEVVFGNTNSPFGPSESGLDIRLLEVGPTGMIGDSEYEPATDGEPNSQGQPAKIPAKVKGNLLLFEHICRPSPRCVRVVDYNQKHPKQTLRGEYLSSDPLKHGIHTDHDTPFLTEAEGNTFARIRYQELHFTNNYYVGTTTSPCVAPGRLFQKLPPQSEWRAEESWQTKTGEEFLVTHMAVEMTQAHTAPSGLALTDPAGQTIQTNFQSEFRCISFRADPDSLVFCPPRVTPVPRLSGVYRARVDASTDGATRPDLDENGAYRIAHIYDERQEVTGGKNSMPVRKAEPYAGEGEDIGMHFPLRQGTEVMVTYFNGNPDRPIIAGALPNATHQSPVKEDNATSHIIKTHSGSLFGIEDGPKDPPASGSAAYQARLMLRAGRKGSYLRLGHPDPDREDSYSEDLQSVTESTAGIFAYSPDNINETAKENKKSVAKNTYTRSLEAHILSGRRMVIHAGADFDDATDATTGGGPVSAVSAVSANNNNMTIYTDRDMTIQTGGDLHQKIAGSIENHTEEDESNTIEGNHLSHIRGSKTTILGGAATSIVGGVKTSIFGGGKISIFGGGKISLVTAASLGLFLGGAANIKLGGVLKIEGPYAAGIGYGAKISKKPEVQQNLYTLKLEAVNLAEVKRVQMEFKQAAIKLSVENLSVLSEQVSMRSAAARLVQSTIHLSM